MTAMLADVLFWTVVLVAGVAIVAFLVLAAVTAPKAKRHPEGWRGSLRDELIALAPLAPFLVLVVVGAVANELRDQTWWTWVLYGLAAAGLAANFLPVVRRARARLTALQRSPAQ
jgi:hypothetical protein